MQLSSNVLAVLALAMTAAAAALPAGDASLVKKDTALKKRRCLGVAACCLSIPALTETFRFYDCITHPQPVAALSATPNSAATMSVQSMSERYFQA